MNDLPQKKKNLIFAFAMNYLIYLLLRLFFYTTYESQLDIMIQAASRGISGKPGAFVLYTHVILGGLLAGLTNVLPWINWYAIMLYVCAYLGMTVISYILVVRTPNKLGMTAATVVTCFAGYECYVLPGYMKVAALLTVAGMTVLFDSAQRDALTRKRKVAVGCMLVFAGMLNVSAFLYVLMIGTLAMLAVILCRRQWKDWRHGTIAAARFVGYLLVATLLLHVADDWTYRATGRELAADTRGSIKRIYGYGAGSYDEDYAEDYGVDSAEFQAIKNGSFAVRGESTWIALESLAREHLPVSLETVDTYFKTVPIGLFRVGIFYLFIILLFLLFYSGWEHKKAVVWTEIGLLLFVFLIVYIFNAWGYNWVSFMVMLPLLLPLFFALEGAEEKEYQYLWVYLVVLSVILYSKFSSSMVTSVREDPMYNIVAGFDQQKVNVIDMNAYLKSYSAVAFYTQGLTSVSNLCISNGAYALMDGFEGKVMAEAFAGDDAYCWIYNPQNISVWDMVIED